MTSNRNDPRLYKDDVDIRFSRTLNSCKLPQIRYASPERLFDRLTDLRFLSIDFLNTFLLTYRVFTDGVTVLEVLKKLHYNPDCQLSNWSPTSDAEKGDNSLQSNNSTTLSGHHDASMQLEGYDYSRRISTSSMTSDFNGPQNHRESVVSTSSDSQVLHQLESCWTKMTVEEEQARFSKNFALKEDCSSQSTTADTLSVVQDTSLLSPNDSLSLPVPPPSPEVLMAHQASVETNLETTLDTNPFSPTFGTCVSRNSSKPVLKCSPTAQHEQISSGGNLSSGVIVDSKDLPLIHSSATLRADQGSSLSSPNLSSAASSAHSLVDCMDDKTNQGIPRQVIASERLSGSMRGSIRGTPRETTPRDSKETTSPSTSKEFSLANNSSTTGSCSRSSSRSMSSSRKGNASASASTSNMNYLKVIAGSSRSSSKKGSADFILNFSGLGGLFSTNTTPRFKTDRRSSAFAVADLRNPHDYSHSVPSSPGTSRLPSVVGSDHNIPQFPKRKRGSIISTAATMRVLNVLRHWIIKESQDFENDEKLMQMTTEFLEELVDNTSLVPAEHKAASQLLAMITKNQQTKQKVDLDVLLSPPTKPSKETIDTLTALEIAEGMTYLDHKIFVSIQSGEFLGQAWMKCQKVTKAHHILLMTRRFNEMSRAVTSEVLRKTELSKRVATIEKWAAVAEICRSLHNFNGVLQICAAFTNSAIFRLKKTWEKMSKTSKQTIDRLQSLVSTDGRFRNMREALHRCDPPCIPYLGMYLTDLSFIEEGTPNFTEDGELLNFSKMRMIAHVIREIKHFQQTPYNIEMNPKVINYLLDNSRHLGDEELYMRSLCLEPRLSTQSVSPRKNSQH